MHGIENVMDREGGEKLNHFVKNGNVYDFTGQ